MSYWMCAHCTWSNYPSATLCHHCGRDRLVAANTKPKTIVRRAIAHFYPRRAA